MKRSVVFIGLFFYASVVMAAYVTDDFDRTDQGSSSNGSLIGPHWVNSDNSDRWAVKVSSLRSIIETPPAVLYNNELETGTEADRSFSLSVDVSGKELNAWVGVVFNYQDCDNYYIFRFKIGSTQYQLNRVVNGVAGGPVFGNDAPVPFLEDVFYTLNVSSTSPYEFNFTITEFGSTAVLNPIATAVDMNRNFTGGYAGIYNTGVMGWAGAYDNFVLNIGSIPSEE